MTAFPLLPWLPSWRSTCPSAGSGALLAFDRDHGGRRVRGRLPRVHEARSSLDFEGLLWTVLLSGSVPSCSSWWASLRGPRLLVSAGLSHSRQSGYAVWYMPGGGNT